MSKFAPSRLGLARTTACALLMLLPVAYASGQQQPSGVASSPALGTYDVVALRVEFQPDTTRFTTGDGTFAGSLFGEGLEPKVDPLPHDAGYFEAHLAFLEHYVATVSDGRANVRTWLLPEVVRVSGRLGDYAPTGFDSDSDAELTKLAALAREAWALADGSSLAGRGFVPGRTAFVLFHAGVGRDIELVGTALDKTPEDLPSLFLSGETLDRLAPGAAPVVAGLPVGNTLVIPRTETRRGFNFITDENFLAEFSINGLLAASFLNFLGVPDLFDTETGQSAVGPFDVMDGLGIFAMQGLFPPEPSAWTRAYLGWADVRTATLTEAGTSYTLPHAGSTDPASVLRVPISAAEYFLVENRYRSTAGVTLRVRKDGVEQEVAFPNDSETFNPYTIDGFEGGVVVAADPYDFALPGGEDEDGNPLLGGALIWHVDERRLAETLATNRVNADKERRAIDLEEADGAQDIGYPSGGFFGPSYDAGSPFDYWYEGNPVSVRSSTGQDLRLYENRFGADTWPASASTAGGESFLEIADFTAAGATMSVTVRRVAGALLEPDLAWERRLYGYPWERFDGPGLLKGLGTGILVFNPDVLEGGLISFPQPPPSRGTSHRSGLAAAEPVVANDGWIYAMDSRGFVRFDGQSTAQERITDLAPGVVERATTPIVRTRQGALWAGIHGSDGYRLIGYDPGQLRLLSEWEMPLSLALTDDDLLVVVGTTRTRVVDGDIDWTYLRLPDTTRVRPAFGRDRDGLFGAVPDPVHDRVSLLLPDGSTVAVTAMEPIGTSGARSETGAAASPIRGHDVSGLSGYASLADLDSDGLLDAIFTAGHKLWAFGRSGAVVAGFPVTLRASSGPSAPLVTRLTDSGGPTVLVSAADGQLDAYDLGDRGQPVSGFPLSIGHGPGPAPAVHEGRLWAVSDDGTLRVWTLPEGAHAVQQLVDGSNSSFVVLADGPLPEGSDFLLDPSETYNWPNPVEDGRTWIRFEVTEPSDIQVTILDLAGRRVAELEHEGAPAGIPVEIPWAAAVESGVYVARVHARSASGRTEDRLVKIAVIR